MLINFLDPKLMPKVRCSCPVTDNYEASNLVSENGAIRARGFLAYTVTRPPVELEFEFLCPINISHVSLDASVGAQRCTGIEVFAKNSPNPYRSIGKAVFDKPGVTFCSSRKYPKGKPPPGFDAASHDLCFFKSDTFRLFCAATAIKIVIFRTQRSVPCLGAARVFAEPARGCSETTVATIQRLAGLLPAPVAAPPRAPFEVPEDFKDALTLEIMAVPMTLPSGKTVDRDTLERHVESERGFGRRPGDPFTGLKFTETRKPVLNVALKSRIDMFLLRNCDNPATRGVKRALGTAFSPGEARRCCVCGDCDVLYEMPCEHFYCRTCLLAAEALRCDKCGKKFEKSQPKRFFQQ